MMDFGWLMTDGSWHGARMPSDPLIANRHPRGRQPSQRRGATLLPRFDQGCNRNFAAATEMHPTGHTLGEIEF